MSSGECKIELHMTSNKRPYDEEINDVEQQILVLQTKIDKLRIQKRKLVEMQNLTSISENLNKKNAQKMQLN